MQSSKAKIYLVCILRVWQIIPGVIVQNVTALNMIQVTEWQIQFVLGKL